MQVPIYNAYLLEPNDGIFKISLVDSPAVESDWLAFNKQKEYVEYSIQDEDQHMVLGVVMRADYLIYRKNDTIGEYYVRYSKDTIKKMAEKFMSDGNQNNINLMHEDGTDVEGVNIVQMFIKDTAKGINPAGFEDIEDGSLFAQYSVSNDDIWSKVKDGTFKGFSLEGYFTVEKTNESVNKSKKTVMNKFKEMMAQILQQFGEVSTDKGTLVFEGDTINEGIEVVLASGDAPEDGEYVAESKKIVVKDGKIESIVDLEVEEEKTDNEFRSKCKEKFASYQEIERAIIEAIQTENKYAYLLENGDDYAIVCESGSDGESYTEKIVRYDLAIAEDGSVSVSNPTEMKQAYVPVNDEVKEEPIQTEQEMAEEEAPAEPEEAPKEEPEFDAKAEIEALKADLNALREQIAMIQGEPATESVEEQMRKAAMVELTGDDKLDRMVSRFAAFRN